MDGRIIKYEDEKFKISFPFDNVLIYEIKLFFNNRKYDPINKLWVVNDSIDKVVEFAKKYNFKINFDTNTICKTHDDKRYARLNDNNVELEFEYNRDIFEDLKKYFGNVRYDTVKKIFTLSLANNNIEEISKFLKKYNFIYDFTLDAKNNIKNVQINKKYLDVLLPFQIKGVSHILQYQNVIIADEMGLGKTIQAIAAIDSAKWYPTLIVCPSTLKYNWKLEYEKWNNDASTSIWYSSKDNEVKDVNIINYDILDKYKDVLIKCNFKSIVFDESHYIKNSKAIRTKAALQISKKINNKILLSGTPINNRPVELISQLRVLNKLSYFGSERDFQIRFCNAHKDDWGHWDVSGANNLIELNTKLRNIGLIRRLKKDVLTELPDKITNSIILDFDNTETKKYKKAENDIILYILEKYSKIEKEQKLEGYALSKVLRAKRAEYLVKLEELKQLIFELKQKYIFEWIDNFLETNVDEKLVIFAKHKLAVQAIHDKYNALIVSGDQTLEERKDAVLKFQTSDDNRIIVLSIDAGKEGITLTRASNMLFVELGWTPLEHLQSEDRIHRIGQKNAVNIYYILARNTIEIDILDLINQKKNIMNQVLNGELNLNEDNNIADKVLLNMLSQNKEVQIL